jgi:cytochrome c biogenesis protein CcdA
VIGASMTFRRRQMSRASIAVALTLFALAWGAVLAAHAATEILFFHEHGCPDCGRVKDSLEAQDWTSEEVVIHFREIHEPGAIPLLERLLAAYEAEVGAVPIVFVGDTAMVGRTFYAPGEEPTTLSELGTQIRLKQVIEKAIAEGAPSPLTRLPQTATEIVFVTGDVCDDCDALAQFVDVLLAERADVGGVILNVTTSEDADLFDRLKRLYGVRGEIPALFVDQHVLIDGTWHERGASPQAIDLNRSDDLVTLRDAVVVAAEEEAQSPITRLEFRERLTIWAVIAAAALDSVNPCDFAVLILLLGTLLVIGRRTKVLWAGLSFTSAIYISYFLLGFLVYSVLGLTIGTRSFREPFIYAVSSIAILVGLWQMKDLLWYGRWLSIEVPDRWKPLVKKVTSSAVTIPGAFVAGIIDSLFLAPCTSGPYLAILSLLSQTTGRLQGVGLLLIYNLIFVIPLLLITLAVHLGFTTTARAERWRTARLGTLHFASGVVMLALGIGMILGVRLGYI